MNEKQIISWLLSGDVSIQYQTRRDLLKEDEKSLASLKSRIAKEGFGKRFMEKRSPNGHWGMRFYQPKWISTHYTLLDLRNIEIEPAESIKNIIAVILKENKSIDGGINLARTIMQSDVCVNGMFLNYASYFGAKEEKLKSIIDYIILQHMPDGGFNCQYNMNGAVHSSLHSTISVLEGITEYLNQGYDYRAEELCAIKPKAIEFIFQHRLYKSDKTGAIIRKSFTMLSYPPRWYYDILRALDYFRYENVPYDARMRDALDLLVKKRNKDGTWNVQAKHPGKVHFDMEQTGAPSRWNTLRALRVLNFYNEEKN